GHGFSFGQLWWPATPANEPTAHWSYLYTLFLTAVYFVSGRSVLVARLLQAVAVGMLMPWLVYKLSLKTFAREVTVAGLAGRLGVNRAELIGLLAAAIVSVYVYFFYYAAALITESFYITSLLWVFLVAIEIKEEERPSWKQWLYLGVAMGTAVLLRQLFLLFIPFIFLWIWWSARPRLLWFVMPAVVVTLMILPFTWRNYQVFDRFVLLNTNSGYAFYWGNHPIHGTHFIPILPDDKGSYYQLLPKDLMTQGLNEAELDSALLGRGLGFVQDDPGRYILLSLSRFAPYFQFWPSANSSTISNIARILSFGLFLPFMLYGLFMALRDGLGSLQIFLKTPTALFLLFMLIYTGIHVLTWTLIRYRLPIDALLIIFAGAAILDLAERFLFRP
ncbi:MAG: hypothetical protein ACE5EY_07775, partial [Anaerolineae bacterium]